MRTLALALVALAGMGIALLLIRPHDEHVAVAKAPHDSVLSSFAPAAKAAARAVPAAPGPVVAQATVNVSPPATAPRRHADRIARAHVVEIQAAAEPEAPPAPGGGATTAAEPPDIDTPRIETDAPPPPPEPLTITETQIVATSSSSVQVAFRTNLPAQTRVSYGIDTPVIWSEASTTDTLDHRATITGLAFSTTYQIWLHTIDEYGQTQAAALTVTTAPMGDQTIATTSGSKILLDGESFFPIAVWGQCSDGLGSSVADGINLFMGDGCGGSSRTASWPRTSAGAPTRSSTRPTRRPPVAA